MSASPAGSMAALPASRADADPGFAGGLRGWLSSTWALLTAGHAGADDVTGHVPGTVIDAGCLIGGIRLSGLSGTAA